MRSHTTIMLLLCLLAPGGCIQQLLSEGDGLVSITATETDGNSTSSTGEPPTPPTSTDSGVQTVTGDQDSTGASPSSSGPDPEPSSGDVNPPPTIELFDASFPGDLMGDPDHMSEAGRVKLQLVTSADVVKVRLYLDGVKLADTDLTPADFPYAWDVLSAKFNGERTFKAEVEDAGGRRAGSCLRSSSGRLHLRRPGGCSRVSGVPRA